MGPDDRGHSSGIGLTRATATAAELSLRAALAATIAVAGARLLDLPYPLYAMIAAVIVIDLVPKRTRELAGARIAGTLLGAAGGALIAQFLPVNAWTFGLGIMGTMFVMHLMRVPDGARLAGYVCGLVLLDHRDNAWLYALDRVIETVLGITVAVALSLLPSLIPDPQSSERRS